MRALLFQSPEEVEAQIQRVLDACGQTVKKVVDLAIELDPLDWFHDVKFKEIGHDGLFDRKQNVIEQVNQTFTYLVTFQGIKYLLDLHPRNGPYQAHIGARKGPDIESEDGTVMAEAFATVGPTNNQKLLKDLQRCAQSSARHKYVFFYSPKIKAGPYQHKYDFPGIAVHRVELPTRGKQLYENGEMNERKWLRAAAHNPAFAFLKEPMEDIYTLADGKPHHDAR